MTKEMIISSNAHETIVAILEDDLAAEIFVERENQRGVVDDRDARGLRAGAQRTHAQIHELTGTPG